MEKMDKETRYVFWKFGVEMLLIFIGGACVALICGIVDYYLIQILLSVLAIVVIIPILIWVYSLKPYKNYKKKMARIVGRDSHNLMKVKYDTKKDYIHVGFRIDRLDYLREILPLLKISTCTMIDVNIEEIYKILEENVEEKIFEEIEEVRKNTKKSYLIFDERTPTQVDDEFKYLLQGHTRFFMAVGDNSDVVHLLINTKSYDGIYEKLRQFGGELE